MKTYVTGAVSALSMIVSTSAFAEPTAEVLHYWTSGGEAKSVAVLQKEFADKGGSWTDMPVAGGGGDAAMTALRARVLSGNAPTAYSLKAPQFRNGTKKAFWPISLMSPKRTTGKLCCPPQSPVI